MVSPISIFLSACALAAALSAPACLAQSPPVVVKAGGLSIESPWVRATPAGATVGGGYMVLRNEGGAADRLLSVSSPAAARGEIHESSLVDGVMRMRAVGGLAIPAGGRIELKPGGLHLMLIDLRERLVEGRPVKAQLVFEKAGAVDVEFAVAPVGAAAPRGHPGH